MDQMQVVEVKGMRVLTTKQLAEAYETSVDTIKVNFGRNKNKYVLGKHYVEIKGEELRDLKNKVTNCYSVGKRVNRLYLWTEKGALLHAKSINTDKAWEVYDYLVDFYFRVKETSRQQDLPKKPAGRQVVDIPVNEKAQALLGELRKKIAGLESVTEVYDRYQVEEDYQKIAYVVQSLGIEVANTAISLGQLKPQIIEKAY